MQAEKMATLEGKNGYSRRKEFAPTGSKFFPFRVVNLLAGK